MHSSTALDGLKVLDFSHALAGPYCTLLLSDYGAEVYKLESPGGGDMGRSWGPPFVGSDAAFFLGLNRGKSGISLDLKHPEGLDLCRRLLGRMDVLIENFRPGTMERLGLGYDTVRAWNPRLVYCSISGYGQDGPARDEAAMDLVVECSSGFLSITGTEAGDQVRSGYAVADINAGLFATVGILMALRSREQTGVGQYVDVSMFDSMISAMTSNYMTYLSSGRTPQPMGTHFPTVVPYRVYQARDRGVSLAAGSDKLWSALCEVMERPDLTAHPDFATNPQRVSNRARLEPLLDEIFAQRLAADWMESLQRAGVPCALVRDFAEVAADAQASVRQMFPSVDHAEAGRQRVVGPAVKLSETPGRVTTSAPALGQDTRRVLADLLELSAIEIDRLVAAGAVIAP